jgi:Uma2 family endonuclease
MNDTDKSSDSEVREALVDYNKRYTYADYMTWDDDKRRELIDGVPYLMSAPSPRHQRLLSNLHGQFWTFLKRKKCEVYFAPLDVRLNADTFDNTVVQPDMLVVCDESILNKAGCKGVPDMVVEILSPSTSRYDRTIKYDTYLKAGIREYWIVDPETKTLAVHILKGSNYIIHPYSCEDTVPVHVLEGFSVDLSEVFEE